MRTPTYIAITSFAESAAGIRSVRDAVFGQEQSVAREIDFDDQDPHCVHAVATDAGGIPIGTGRMQPDGRIGRLSVLKQWRGQGVGTRMLEALVASARKRGFKKVYLHAQVQVIPFYERRGFARDGAEFLEAGMSHVTMTRSAR
jgi:predicted GNAT family N-acyltransferase